MKHNVFINLVDNFKSNVTVKEELLELVVLWWQSLTIQLEVFF